MGAAWRAILMQLETIKRAELLSLSLPIFKEMMGPTELQRHNKGNQGLENIYFQGQLFKVSELILFLRCYALLYLVCIHLYLGQWRTLSGIYVGGDCSLVHVRWLIRRLTLLVLSVSVLTNPENLLDSLWWNHILDSVQLIFSCKLLSAEGKLQHGFLTTLRLLVYDSDSVCGDTAGVLDGFIVNTSAKCWTQQRNFRTTCLWIMRHHKHLFASFFHVSGDSLVPWDGPPR